MCLKLCLMCIFRNNSMVSFLIAFGFMCLQDSGIATRSVIAILCGMILILTFWSIWTSWRNQEPSHADEPKRTTLTFEEDHVKQKEKGFKFRREESDTTETQRKRPPTRRSRTLSSLRTSLKVPFKKLRRDSSKKEVEESIGEMVMS